MANRKWDHSSDIRCSWGVEVVDPGTVQFRLWMLESWFRQVACQKIHRHPGRPKGSKDSKPRRKCRILHVKTPAKFEIAPAIKLLLTIDDDVFSETTKESPEQSDPFHGDWPYWWNQNFSRASFFIPVQVFNPICYNLNTGSDDTVEILSVNIKPEAVNKQQSSTLPHLTPSYRNPTEIKSHIMDGENTGRDRF